MTAPTPELLANIRRKIRDYHEDTALFRVEMFDSISVSLADRLAIMLGGENVEIEAKLGRFTLKGEPYILHDLDPGFYPLAHNPQPAYKFESEVSRDRFEYLRKMVLNGRAENFRVHGHDPEIKFIQTHTIDSMYSTDNPNVNIRVTRNLEGEIVACITKQDALPTGPNSARQGSHINILTNAKKHPLDCRISVKREMPAEPPPITAIPFYTREKIRSSYQIGMFSIDLTELPLINKDNNTKITTYEVEIEFLAQYMPMIRQALADFQPGNTPDGLPLPARNGNFIKIVRNLVQTIRTIIQYSVPGTTLPLLCSQSPLPDAQGRKLKKFDVSKSSAVVSLNQGGLAGESRM